MQPHISVASRLNVKAFRSRFAIGTFVFCSGVFMFQAYAHLIPTFAYIGLILLFIAAVLLSIIYLSESVALLGVFLYSLSVRLMFYVFVRFLVFPFGDPYGAYGVLELFSSSSHVSIFQPNVYIFDQSNYLAVLANQYSQWPGLQVLTLAFSRVTGVSLLQSAMALTFVFYIVWFFVAYTLIKLLLFKVNSRVPNLAVICMAFVTSLPTSEMPPYFKYDFPATIMLLICVTLLLKTFDRYDLKYMILLCLLTAAIVITHSLTAFVWIALVGITILGFILRPVVNAFVGRMRGMFQASQFELKEQHGLLRLLVFGFVIMSSWWMLYSKYMQSYIILILPKLKSSVSLQALSVARTAYSGNISTLTPEWLLLLLHLRDYIELALIFAGTMAVIVGYRMLRSNVSITLIGTMIITVLTEVVSQLNFGDRAFLLFAPLIGVVGLLSLMMVGQHKLPLAKIAFMLVLVLFMLTISLGFWGSSYAPVQLFEPGYSPTASSGRPLAWPQVIYYLTYVNNSRSSFILTNEIHVTSLAVPVDLWNKTRLVGDITLQPGFVVVMFSGLNSTMTNNASYFGFSEPYHPYPKFYSHPAFSYREFYNELNISSDVVFSTQNVTIYYYL